MTNPDPVLVTVFLDDSIIPGPEGFVRLDTYAVNAPAGKLVWHRGEKKTLTAKEGGTAPGRCQLGVCAHKSDLNLSTVVSFYRAPDSDGKDESPFLSPPIRRMDKLAPPTLLTNGGPDKEDVFLYPILSENFVNQGNYFYTLCVRVKGTEKFYICDPEMEIGPYSQGGDQ